MSIFAEEIIPLGWEIPRPAPSNGGLFLYGSKCHNIIRTYEEKESDVRIATQIVADAFKHNCDIAIIVSADSDMIPAVELAKEAQIKVFIYFPPHHFSSNLSVMGNGTPIHMLRYEAKFKKAVLPDEIVLANGYHLSIPDKWRELRK